MNAQKHTKTIFFLALGLLLLPALLICFYLYSSSFEEVSIILAPEKIYKTIEGKELQGSLFNIKRFSHIRYASLFIVLVQILITIFLIKNNRRVIHFIKGFYSFAKQKLNQCLGTLINLSKYEAILFWCLFIILFIYKIYLVLHIPLNDDETRSYEYFVHQGFWITSTYYPDTNNHIFYNLVCFLFDQVLDDSVLVMRVPVLIASLFLLLLAFCFIKRNFNYKVAILFLVFAGFTPALSYYGAIGRGHIFVALFTPISIVSVFNSKTGSKEPDREYRLLVFIGASVLGLFTVPTYLFVLCSLIAFVVISSLRNFHFSTIPSTLIAVLFIIIGAMFCYLPLMVANGYEVLTANRWTTPLGYNQAFSLFIPYCAEYFEYMLGLGFHIKKGYLITIAILSLLLLSLKQFEYAAPKKWVLLMISFTTIPLVAIFIFKIFPPYRVFTYMHFTLYIGIAFLLTYFTEKLSLHSYIKWAIYLILIAFIMYSSFFIWTIFPTF